MGMLLNILGLPLMGPLNGIKWIAEKVDNVVKQTTSNRSKLKSDLLELSMQLELEKITQEEFNKKENEILAELDKLEKEER